MKKILASSILIIMVVGNAQSAQISMDDSITLNALYNAKRCAPIYKQNGDKYKEKWAIATVEDINKIMADKYDKAMLQAEADAFSERVSKQSTSGVNKMCEELYERRYYLY